MPGAYLRLVGDDATIGRAVDGTGYRLRLATALGGSVGFSGSENTEWDFQANAPREQKGRLLLHDGLIGRTWASTRAAGLAPFLRGGSIDAIAFLVGGGDALARRAPIDVRSDALAIVSPLSLVPQVKRIVVFEIPPIVGTDVGPYNRALAEIVGGKVELGKLQLFSTYFTHRARDVVDAGGRFPTRFGFELLADDIGAVFGVTPLPRATPPPVLAARKNAASKDAPPIVGPGAPGTSSTDGTGAAGVLVAAALLALAGVALSR